MAKRRIRPQVIFAKTVKETAARTKRQGKSKKTNKNPNSGKVSITGQSRDLACSMLDPWSCSACVPDGANGTGCFTMKDQAILSTGTTSGTACGIALHPGVNTYLKIDSATAGATTPTFAGNWLAATAGGSITGQYAKWRPVSAGLKLEYIGPTVTDGGTLLVGLVSPGQPLSAFSGASIGTACNLCMNYKTFPVRNGAKITWRPQDMSDVMNFDNSSILGVASALPVPYLIALVYGAGTNQAVLNAEYVVNMEGQFKAQTFIPGGIHESNAPVADPGWYEKTINVLRKFDPIMPFVGTIADMAVPGLGSGLMSLANGLKAPGLLVANRRKV